MTPETLQLIKTLASIGGWIVISLFFMGQASGYIPSPTTKIQIMMEEHGAREEAMRASLEAHRARQEALLDTLKTGIKVICQNSSHSQAEWNNCNNIR